MKGRVLKTKGSVNEVHPLTALRAPMQKLVAMAESFPATISLRTPAVMVHRNSISVIPKSVTVISPWTLEHALVAIHTIKSHRRVHGRGRMNSFAFVLCRYLWSPSNTGTRAACGSSGHEVQSQYGS